MGSSGSTFRFSKIVMSRKRRAEAYEAGGKTIMS
jgi:hypothetical protein